MMGTHPPELISAKSKGFTLLELMIALAIVGVLAAVGFPMYHGYIETTNTSRVNAAYEHAISSVQQEFSKDSSMIALGITSN